MNIRQIITGTLFLALTAINALPAETVFFKQNQFIIDAVKQQITTSQSDTVDSKFFKSFRVPAIGKQLTGLTTVPDKITIRKMEMKAILSGIKYQQPVRDTLKVLSTYSNQPAKIASAGFARGEGILNLELCPFVFRQDTLYFVEKLEYELSDFQEPFATDSKSSEEVDLLIVGSNQFSTELNNYRKFKLLNGLKTDIAYVEDIVLTTQGKDNAHRIRNYIKEYYRTKKIRFVLLAGDVNLIPAVMFKKDANAYYDAVVSDQFYSNFDKEFDSNSNGVYADNTDIIDFYPEVHLGRWPVASAGELKTIVDKTLNYLSGTISTNADYYKKILLIAFNLGENTPGDSEGYCNNVGNSAGTGMVPDHLYIHSTPNMNINMMVNKLNGGANVVYAQAHGTANKFGVHDGWGIFSDHIYNLTTPSGLYLIASCYPGDYSVSGMVVKGMVSPNGGCVNYIGTSGKEFPGSTQNMHNFTIQQLVGNKNIGTAFDYARRYGFSDLAPGSNTKQLYFGYNLQGDPSNYVFMHQPVVSTITNLSAVKKGAGTLTGSFTANSASPVKVVLLANGRIVGSANTNTNQFTVNYTNLFADSVTVAISSPDILFKKSTVATVANSQDLQVTNLQIRDANNSGVVESKEKFKIAFKLKSLQNQTGTDSLKVVFRTTAASFTNLLCDSVMVAWPTLGVDTEYTVLNFQPDFSTLFSDTVLIGSLQIFPAENQSSPAQNMLFQQNMIIQAANPKLDISWVRYSDYSVTFPMLINNSSGSIDHVSIKLHNPNLKNSGKDVFYILKNIPGKALLYDSLLFLTNQSVDQRLEIVQNNQDSYLTSAFKKSLAGASQIDSIKLSVNNIGKQLSVSWNNFSQNSAYNVYLYINDTTKSVAPVNTMLLTRPEFVYNFASLPTSSNIYLRIGLVDKQSFDQYAVSKFIKANLIPQYANAPYSLLPFQLYNPTLVENKIVANTENGSLVAIPASGSGFTGNGSFYHPQAYGFENDHFQGKAFGNVTGSSQRESVHLSYPGTMDSVYLHVVNLQSGQLIAKKTIYGQGMYVSPVLANIDSDPELEILFSLFNGNSPLPMTKGGYVYAYDCINGNLLLKSGFPIVSTKDSYVVSSPVVADFNNNGTKELLVSCGKWLELYNLQTMAKIAEIALVKPLVDDPVICDLNNDQKPEIICIESNEGAIDGKLKVFSLNNNNEILPFWANEGIALEMYPNDFYKPGASPVIADIDLNGDPEIVAVTGKKLYVYKTDGSYYPGYPINIPFAGENNNVSCPSLADLNGDGKLDILFIDNNSNIHAYSGSNAQELTGFPVVVPNSARNQFGSLNIADLDQDNDLEILAGAAGGKMYIYDYPYTTSNRQIYSYYRADLENSGIFGRTDVVSIDNPNVLPAQFALIGQYPNPFNPVTNISFYLPAAHDVQFKVFNTLGQLVYQANKSYNASGIKSIAFNGSNLGSGLYIYSLKYGNEIKTGKCTLLK